MFHRRVAAALALLLVLPGLAGAAEIELISKTPPRLAPDAVGGAMAENRSTISADGRYVVFVSLAHNLAPGQSDLQFNADIFLHDRATGTNRLISHAAGSPNTPGDRGSEQPSISADGRFVAFVSAARNLVPGTAGAGEDTRNVYLWNRDTGRTILVSRRAGGSEGADGSSLNPSLSADGNVLVFTSQATDLVPGLDLEDSGENVYLYERNSGTVRLVSRSAASANRAGNQSSFGATVSADGRVVAYLSGATDLVTGQNDTNGGTDVFLFDRLTGATTLASHADGSALTTADGSSQGPSLSADGRYVAFESLGSDLVAGVSDFNNIPDAFFYDRLLGTVSLVSFVKDARQVASGGFQPEISEDGGTVLYFLANLSRLRDSQIVAVEILTGSLSLVTRAPASPSAEANRGALAFSMSADGRIVAFTSNSTNLVAGQQDTVPEAPDLFVHDRSTGATALVSHAAGSLTRTADRGSHTPALSADGSWIAYGSTATDLAADVLDAGATADVFLYERTTGANRTLTRHAPGMASLTAYGASLEPSLSADGRYVAFVGYDWGLVPGLTVPSLRSNIYLHDRVTRRTFLVSRSTRAPLAGGDADSRAPRISRDGSVVAFNSLASDLVPGQEDRPGTSDVFLWDRRTGRMILVSRAHASRARAGTGDSQLGDVSADGNLVAFNSTAPGLVARQQNVGFGNVFVWDRRTGATALVSHHGLRPSRTGNGFSSFSSMSPDGAFIAFESGAADLVLPIRDRNAQTDAFLYQRRTGQISLLSRKAGGLRPLISANGRWASFISIEREGGVKGSVVLLDRANGRTLVVAPPHPGFPQPLGLSDNGRWLLFRSDVNDLILFDRVSRETRLVSHVPGDPLRPLRRGLDSIRLSPNGRWVTFLSDFPIPLLANVFLYDRTTEELTVVSSPPSAPGQGGSSQSSGPVVINSGLVAFASQAANLVPRDFNFGNYDVFVYTPLRGGLW